MKVKVQNIAWEADNMNDVKDLATEVTVDIPNFILNGKDVNDISELILDYIVDEISNEVGFTHLGFGKVTIIE